MQFLVIKCGGSVFENLPDAFYAQVVRLQKEGLWYPVIVHGGGPSISAWLDQLNIPSTFVNGLRVTTQEVLEAVEMVLSGKINKMVVSKLKQAGGQAIGLSGVDADLLKAVPVANHRELGYVGQVEKVNDALLRLLAAQGLIPVISPIGQDEAGQHYNINADLAAAAVAASLGATLCFVSDIPGIYIQSGDEKTVLSRATKSQIEELIERKIITGGMIPKVQAALSALSQRVPQAVILDGRDPKGLAAFCRGEAVGTQIVLEEEMVHG